MDKAKQERAYSIVHELRHISEEEGSLDEKFGQRGLIIALYALEGLLKPEEGE